MPEEKKEGVSDLDDVLKKLGGGKKEEKKQEGEAAAKVETSEDAAKLQQAKAELEQMADELDMKKVELDKQKQELKQREEKASGKEANIKRATELLLTQRETVEKKEKEMQGIKDSLRTKAEELTEREGRAKEFKVKSEELEKTEKRIKELEEGLKKRESHLKDMESRISDCPRCSSFDRYVKTERLLEDLKDFGFELEQEERDLKGIQALIDEDRRGEAITKAEVLLKRLNELHDEVAVKAVMFNYARGKWLLKYAKEQGAEPLALMETEGLLGQAHQLILAEDYKSADWYVREATIHLENIVRGVGTVPQAPPVAPKTYICPNCRTEFAVDIDERPAQTTCPGCGTMLVVIEEIKYA